MQYEVEGSLSQQDVLALNDHQLHASPTMRRQVRRTQVMLVLWFGLFGGALFMFGQSEQVSYLKLAGGVFAGFGILTALWIPSGTRRRMARHVRSLLEEGSNLGLFGPQQITITPTEVKRSTELGYMATYWPGVERIEQGHDRLFIYVSSMSALIVPKRHFETELAYQEFVDATLRYHESGQSPSDRAR